MKRVLIGSLSKVLSLVVLTSSIAFSSCEKEKNVDSLPDNFTYTVDDHQKPPVNNNTFSVLIDFESFDVPTDSFLNGSVRSGKFVLGELTFTNDYDTTYSSWSGFACSNIKDSTTAGYGNQYASYAGSGANNSSNYMVYYPGFSGVHAIKFSTPRIIDSIKVTNSTYSALSMKIGDAFTKRFGGVSYTDQDSFMLTIKAYGASGNYLNKKIDFFLADYRASSSNLDYIVKAWININLSSLGSLSELRFDFTSSDNGQFGMNTPSYFCLDNISYKKN